MGGGGTRHSRKKEICNQVIYSKHSMQKRKKYSEHLENLILFNMYILLYLSYI